MDRDYYQLLEVGSDASTEEIKRSYRNLVRQYHPDVNPGDPQAEERFKAIAVAYEVLSDPERRRQYDMFGTTGGLGSGGPEASFGDIFEMFFGSGFGGGFRGRQERSTGGDVVVEAELAFEQAVFGTTLDLPPIEMLVGCDKCDSSGAEPGTHPQRCSRCNGAGEVRDVRRTFLGNVITAYPCQNCGGSGEELASPCDKCSGEGRVPDARELTVEVPAGIEDGSQLRIEGRGHAARRGGIPGDLYVTLRVRPHERLRRDGIDLIFPAKVSIAQAALGTTLSVPTLDGDRDVRVEPGTQHGTVLKLKGMGVPKIRGRGRGDLRIPLRVEVPTEMSDEEAELLRRLAELRGEDISQTSPGVRDKVKGLFKS